MVSWGKKLGEKRRKITLEKGKKAIKMQTYLSGKKIESQKRDRGNYQNAQYISLLQHEGRRLPFHGRSAQPL